MKLVLPPPLKTSEIISVQPMSRPSGLIFHLDYTYGEGHKKNPFRRTKVKCVNS